MSALAATELNKTKEANKNMSDVCTTTKTSIQMLLKMNVHSLTDLTQCSYGCPGEVIQRFVVREDDSDQRRHKRAGQFIRTYQDNLQENVKLNFSCMCDSHTFSDLYKVKCKYHEYIY